VIIGGVGGGSDLRSDLQQIAIRDGAPVAGIAHQEIELLVEVAARDAIAGARGPRAAGCRPRAVQDRPRTRYLVGGSPALVATGANLRGVIDAAYAVSEELRARYYGTLPIAQFSQSAVGRVT
jgi:hypothetical protein